MSILTRVAYVAGGALVAAGASSLDKNGHVHGAAVKAAAVGMRAADVVRRVTQTIADEAFDINAEARRQAKIDAAVRERIAGIEADIRAEVEAEIDGAA